MGVETHHIDSLDAITPEGCAAAIHLAVRVHVKNDAAADALAELRTINVNGRLKTADAASRTGANRFVFVSGIKALAELDPGHRLTEPTHAIHPNRTACPKPKPK
ncbi:hypothetical protein [Caballeronia novacaledonica]|uniref:Uncharacterized protein n=1 Tax=Caballeronia novacaledonica TaxID=1544861 RepID=A0AA37IBE0_9BURK|nr:hypothetical protein [Caballeronia novacaledonica]GJH26017.1 hypothetical protein CBA19CS42_15895 [Caballeronia novacaledonica]